MKTLSEQIYELEEELGMTHDPREIQELAEVVYNLQD